MGNVGVGVEVCHVQNIVEKLQDALKNKLKQKPQFLGAQRSNKG